MKLESIENLRIMLDKCKRTEQTEKPFDTYWITKHAADVLIDEIQTEVDERFMPLPMDADGVPIRVGDTMEAHLLKDKPKFTAKGVIYDGVQWHVKADDAWSMSTNLTRHVKPRTLEGGGAMTELKPCPFCGSTAAPCLSDVYELEECVRFDDCEWHDVHGACEGCDRIPYPTSVVCDRNAGGCGSCGPYKETAKDAAAAWNRRTAIVSIERFAEVSGL